MALPAVNGTDSLVTRRIVTVLFCDLVGSTSLGEALDAELVRSVLADHFRRMAAVITAHGGTVEKYIGDAIMAVFGLPVMHEDDALRAVRAAMGMRMTLAGLNAELEERGVRLETRTGIATGSVVAGDPAAGGTLVTGDAVNTAARVQAAAGAGDVLVTESTWRLVRASVAVESLTPLSLKGKAAAVPAFRVLTLVEDGVSGTIGAGVSFVGRVRELGALDDAHHAVIARRRPGLVVVAGSPGIGKSRLVGAWVAGCSPETLVLRGRCLSYGEGVTWWPLRGILHAAAGITADDDAPTARARLAALVADLPDADVVTARLSGILGLSDAPAAGEETRWAVRVTIERIARDRPLVLLIEDIHWAEPPLLDLLEHLVSAGGNTSVMILCPARPELRDLRPAWSTGRPGIDWIDVDPLDAAATDALVASIPGAAGLPDGLRSRALAAAEGNPLFLEELVRLLVDEGANGTDVPLPPTIGALLAARLDALPAGEQGTARRASVVGRAFEAATVVALTPPPARADVRDAITGLMRRELVQSDPLEGDATLDAGDTYRFRHILIRDAAYEGLAKADRADLHERFADWLEQRGGDRVTEYQELLGHHLARAFGYRMELRQVGEATRRLGERAALHLAASGRRARERGEAAVAVGLLRQAEVLPFSDPGARIDVLLELAQAEHAGDPATARAIAERALLLANESSDRGRMAQARVHRWSAMTALGEITELEPASVAEVDAALADALASGDPWARAIAWDNWGLIRYLDGDMEASMDAQRRSIEAARETDDLRLALEPETMLFALAVVGTTSADEVVALARDLYPRVRPWPFLSGDVLRLMAPMEAMIGEQAVAEVHAREAIRVCRALGQPAMVAHSEADLSWVLRLGGDLEGAVAAARRGYDETVASQDPNLGAHIACRLAQWLLMMHRTAEAEPWLDLAERNPMVTTRTRILGARARIRAAQGDPAAGDGIPEMLGMLEGTHLLNVRMDACIDAAVVSAVLGRSEEARRYADEALGLARRKGNRPMARWIVEFLEAIGG